MPIKAWRSIQTLPYFCFIFFFFFFLMQSLFNQAICIVLNPFFFEFNLPAKDDLEWRWSDKNRIFTQPGFLSFSEIFPWYYFFFLKWSNPQEIKHKTHKKNSRAFFFRFQIRQIFFYFTSGKALQSEGWKDESNKYIVK